MCGNIGMNNDTSNKEPATLMKAEIIKKIMEVRYIACHEKSKLWVLLELYRNQMGHLDLYMVLHGPPTPYSMKKK